MEKNRAMGRFIYKIYLTFLIHGGLTMEDVVEIGKVSSRGQIAIPADIRRKMNLKEGQKVLFFFGDGTLLVKKVMPETFSEITKPLKEAAKKAGINESDVPGIIHRFRAKK